MNAPVAESTATQAPAPKYDFRTGIPDLEHFPFAAWNRIQRNVLDQLKPGQMLYGDAAGYEPLRRAIARFLLQSRGVAADPESVFITSGSTQALSLAVDTLKRDGEGKAVVVENPCHQGISRMLALKKITAVPVGVDEHGLLVEQLPAYPTVAVYVTPSHQFPLGSVLSAARRVTLMQRVREQDAYVIEDDYDSEYRYAGLPLTPLHALDPDRVLYLGTFSKTLFPALRIGFALVPARFRSQWRALRRYADVQSPVMEQALLAEFLESGRMARHVRAMNKLYGKKRDALVAALEENFGDRVGILGDKTGLHLAARFAGCVFGREFKERCKENGLAVTPCAAYEAGTDHYADTLLLGYGNLREDRIQSGVAELKRLVCG